MSTGFFDFHARVQRRGATAAEVAAAQPAGTQALTVTELSARVASAIRGAFEQPVWVKGEVCDYRGANRNSGHHYFGLKDARNNLKCVMWAGDAAGLRFKFQDGMELLAYGTVATYGPQSSYQLRVTRLQPVGQGALELAFQQLKAGLEREGLFAEERKKPLPAYPRRIAIVTSRDAAGYHDMRKVLARFGWLKLMVVHVPVQGAAAHPAIAAALHAINRHVDRLGGVDAILLGRGGGSLQDLWAFNEEVVARAIAASRIPIVTGVGHEVDVTIADLVADYHAHTPTEAARVLTHGWQNAVSLLSAAEGQLRSRTASLASQGRLRLSSLARHELFRRPAEFLVGQRQHRIDQLQHRLDLAVRNALQRRHGQVARLDERLQQHRPAAQLTALRSRLDRLATRLAEQHPRHAVRTYAGRVDRLQSSLAAAVSHLVAGRRAQLDALTRQLDAVGPLQVLQRGYSITMRLRDRQIIRSVKEIQPGDRMVTRFADGEQEWTAGDGQLKLF